jgi:hypothetical protein
MVTVGSTATGNAKIVGVSRLMKGLQVDELFNPPVYFDLDDYDTNSVAVFNALPDWLKGKIQEAMNFNTTKFGKMFNSGAEPEPTTDDNNPF